MGKPVPKDVPRPDFMFKIYHGDGGLLTILTGDDQDALAAQAVAERERLRGALGSPKADALTCVRYRRY